MPTINPSLVPTIAPGSLFSVLTTDTSVNIRFLVANDPVFFEVFNRPLADLALRQLIIAKTLDAINLRLSHQSEFPFLIPAKVSTGTAELFLPSSWIWDLHVSLPKKWEKLRLAKIKRISGSNATDITGRVRLIFTGQEQGSNFEVALFQTDYVIDSTLEFQFNRIIVTPSSEEPNAIEAGEAETLGGFIILRTLDLEDNEIKSFFEALAPPIGGTDSNSDGIFDNPAVFEIVDTPAGGSGVSNDFSFGALSHGTGILVVSAYNAIPALDSDANVWLLAFNYPFRIGADRESSGPIVTTIPAPIFSEFNLCVPCGDEPTGDVTGAFSPVWVSRIRRCDDIGNRLEFFFATFHIKKGQESTDQVEFATLVLERNFLSGRVVTIEPLDDLLLAAQSDQELFQQDFGRGHVRLSSLWTPTTDVIDSFFDAFQSVIDDPADVLFTKESTIISAPGTLSRYSRTTPTTGQSEALAGTTARRIIPVDPSDSNRYLNEADQGLGDKIDFRLVDGFVSNPNIEEIAFTGSLAHQIFVLIVDSNAEGHTYDEDILPRIRHLLGRDPVFGDTWFDGTRFKQFSNAGAWIG